MPIYEYHCEKCQIKFDRIKKMTEESSTANCAVCGTECKKIISKTTFKLNGGGWADTGYQK